MLPTKILANTTDCSQDMLCNMIAHAAWLDLFEALITPTLCIIGSLLGFHVSSCILREKCRITWALN